jgi:hypothetical protein
MKFFGQLSVVLFLLLFAAAGELTGQVLGSRYVHLRLPADSSAKIKIFPYVSALMQNSKGVFSHKDELAWGAFFAERVILLQKKRHFIIFQASQEINADQYNDIGFNPKTAVWMEEFSWAKRHKNGIFQFGFQHRSKHDIDNGEPIVWDTTKRFFPESRVIILNGTFAGISFEKKSGENWSFLTSLRAEWYLVHYDSRFPYGNKKQSWNNARFSTLLTMQAERKVLQNWAVYGLCWVNPVVFSDDSPLKANYRAELGIKLFGERAVGRVFTAYEYFFDHLYRPFPVSNATLWFGMRVSGLDF